MNSTHKGSLKISFILISAITLSACSTYQEHFKCKAQPGLGCASITEVNDLVNQGWPLIDARKKVSSQRESVFNRLFKCKCKNTVSDNHYSDSRVHFLNHHPETLRIWIAPHESQNQYWDEQFVYSALASKSAQNLKASNASEVSYE